MHCVVEDGVEYRLQVVWRTRNGAQHFRDGCPLPKNLGQLLLQLCIAASSFRPLAGFELIHCSSFPIQCWLWASISTRPNGPSSIRWRTASAAWGSGTSL